MIYSVLGKYTDVDPGLMSLKLRHSKALYITYQYHSVETTWILSCIAYEKQESERMTYQPRGYGIASRDNREEDQR